LPVEGCQGDRFANAFLPDKGGSQKEDSAGRKAHPAESLLPAKPKAGY